MPMTNNATLPLAQAPKTLIRGGASKPNARVALTLGILLIAIVAAFACSICIAPTHAFADEGATQDQPLVTPAATASAIESATVTSATPAPAAATPTTPTITPNTITVIKPAATDSGTIADGAISWEVDASNTLVLSTTNGTVATFPSWTDKESAKTTLPWLSSDAIRTKITGFKITESDTIKVAQNGSLAGMFAGLTKLVNCNLQGLNTANALNMTSMFEGCTSLTTLNISSFKTGKCTNMSSMFKGCTSLKTLDLTLIATLNVTDMTSMFEGCSNLTTIKADDGFETKNDWIVNQLGGAKTASANMFKGCTSLIGGDGTKFNSAATDCNMAQVDNSRYYPGYFTKVINQAATSFAVYSATDNSLRFYKRAFVPSDGTGGTARTSAENWDGYHEVTNVYYGISPADPTKGFEVELYHYMDNGSVSGSRYWITTAPWRGRIPGSAGIKTVAVCDYGIAPNSMSHWFFIFSDEGITYTLPFQSFKMRAIDTSKITDLSYMFYMLGYNPASRAHNFKMLDVRGWDTSKVKNFGGFLDCSYIETLDISSWDTSNVENMYSMFRRQFNLHTIYVGEKWSTSKVTESTVMFGGSDKLFGGSGTQAGSSSDQKTSAVIDGEGGKVGYLTSGNVPYAVWNEGNKTLTIKNVLYSLGVPTGDGAWKIDLNGYSSATTIPWYEYRTRVQKVVVENDGVAPLSMAYWFSGFTNCTSFNLANLSTHKLTNMTHMFDGATAFQNFDMSDWKTGNVTDMSYLFKGCTSLKTVNLLHITTVNVTDMASMFEGCSSLTTIYADDGFEVITANIARLTGKTKTPSANMFKGCTSLVGGDGTRYSSLAVECDMASVDNKLYYPGYFTKVIDTSAKSFAVYSATDKSLRFYKRPNMPTTGTSAQNWDGYHEVTAVWDCCNADHPDWDFENYAYGYRVVAGSRWGGGHTRTNAPWGDYIVGLYTIRAVDFGIAPKTMTNWFNESAWYEYCNYTQTLKSIHLRAIDTSNVTNMEKMIAFESTQSTSQPHNLTYVDVRGWNTSKVTNMQHALIGLVAVKELDLSSWDTTKALDMRWMLVRAQAAVTIYVGEKWSTDKEQYNCEGIFAACSSLVGGNGTPWSGSYIDKSHARIDGKDGLPGYLTYAYSLYAVYREHDKSLSFENVHANLVGLTGDAAWKYTQTAYSNASAVPWNAYASRVQKVIVKDEGVAPTSTAYWFSGFPNCTSYDLAKLNTDNITNAAHMFDGATGLQSFDMTRWAKGSMLVTTSMFAGCTALTSVKLPAGMTSIGANAFSGCSALGALTLPATATTLGTSAFKGCTNLASINLPAGITAIPAEAFSGCAKLALTSLPANVTSIGASAFKGCTKLALTNLPASVATIGNSAFENCATISGNWNLPALITLGERAFAGCTRLESASFSSLFATIGESAFAGAVALKSVSFAANRAPQVTSTAATANPASTLFAGNTQATINIKWGDEGYNAQGWELFRIRMSDVPYFDAYDPAPGAANNRLYANDVRLLEAWAKMPGAKLNEGWYVLNGVMSGVVEATERLKLSGDVKVILTAAKISAPKGIEVPAGATLTVYSQTLDTDQAGTIEVTAPDAGNAGIGAAKGQATGTINITGGKIDATGGSGAAGIGAAQTGSIGTINITGGKIDATGGQGAAGIGGAAGSSQGKINITGGDVSASGTNAPGIGSPTGASGTLEIDVTGDSRVVATNNGGDVIVGSPDHQDTTIMDIGGAIIATTGADKAPSRDAIGCDNPVVEKGGIVLVVEDETAIHKGADGSITLDKPSVLLTNGYETGIEVTGGTKMDADQKVTLQPGGSMTFVNSANKKVTITAPDNSNATTEISLGQKNHIELPEGVKVSVDGKNLLLPNPIILDASAAGKVQDTTQSSADAASFNQNVSELVNPSNTILAEEDSDKYTCGFDVNIWLETKDVEDADDKALIDKQLVTSKLGKLLDITLYYRVLDGVSPEKVAIHESAVPIKVKFSVPQDLLTYAKNIKRTFKLMRVHTDVSSGAREVATIATFSASDLASGIVSFASDKFSAYALVYDDEVIPEPIKPQTPSSSTGNNGSEKPGSGNNNASDPAAGTITGAAGNTGNMPQQASYNLAATSDAPATGDTASALPLAAAATFALAALLALATLRRRTCN